MQVVLSWTASLSANVLYYRIYRGFQTGGPYQLIGQSKTRTYTDITNPNQQNAYYVVSAVTADGESAYSSEYAAVAPSQPSAPTSILATIT